MRYQRILAISAALLAVASQRADAQRLPADSLEIGRRYARWFLMNQNDSISASVPAETWTAMGGTETLLRSQAMVAERAGREAALVEERFVWRNGKRQYWRTMQMTAMEEHFLLRVVIEHDGRFGGYGLGPANSAPPVDSSGAPIRKP
jgi:hypothetical protein